MVADPPLPADSRRYLRQAADELDPPPLELPPSNNSLEILRGLHKTEAPLIYLKCSAKFRISRRALAAMHDLQSAEQQHYPIR